MQDCLSAIVVVTWQAGSGLDFYTATMQTDSGISNVCMSDSNECSVPGLTCGHNFTVSVTASNSLCNATSTETTSLQSGETVKGCQRTESLKCKLTVQHKKMLAQFRLFYHSTLNEWYKNGSFLNFKVVGAQPTINKRLF